MRAAFDELFAHLDNWRETYVRDPSILFQREVDEQLDAYREHLEEQREIEAPVVSQAKALATLDILRDSVEKTTETLANLEHEHLFQQQRMNEYLVRLEAILYQASIDARVLGEFEAMLNKSLGAIWRQQDRELLVKKYAANKKEMMKSCFKEFNAKFQTFLMTRKFLSLSVFFLLYLDFC